MRQLAAKGRQTVWRPAASSSSYTGEHVDSEMAALGQCNLFPVADHILERDDEALDRMLQGKPMG